jgi:hypothetical protein
VIPVGRTATPRPARHAASAAGGRLAAKLGNFTVEETTEDTLVRRQLTAAIATLVLAASPVMAANGNIGLYFDQTGAEYKVQVGPNNNADPGWFFNETFDPAATTVGSGAFTPVDNAARGINVAWPACQHGDGVKVLIETVDVLNGNCSTAELQLKVVKHDSSSNQFFQCPLFVLCDDPTFTKVCVGYGVVNNCRNPEPPFPNNAQCSTSGVAYINPVPNRNCAIIGVQPTSWSTMKGLYRN